MPTDPDPSQRAVLPVAGAAAGGLTIVLAVYLQTRSGSDRAQDVGDACQFLAALVASLACARAARRKGPESRAWVLLAVACGMWAAAAALWGYNGQIRDHVYPFPSLADLGFLGYALPLTAGLLAFPRSQSRRVSRARALLDGLLVATGVLFVSGATVLGPALAAEGDGLAKLTAISYPVVNVAMASLVLILGLRRPAGARLTWVFLGGGLFAMAVSDNFYVSLSAAGQQAIGTPVQAGWAGAFLLFALATLVPAVSGEGKARPHFTVLQELLPYVPVLAAIVVAATRQDPVRLDDPLLTVTGMLFLGALIVHQVLVAVEKVSLTAGLEATVALRSEQLRTTDERFGSLVESSEDSIVSRTVGGVVTSWNPAAERLYGYGADEMIGRSFTVLVPPERLEEEFALLAAAAAGGRKRYETERLRKDGTMVPVSLTVSPILAAGQVQGVSTIGHDITDRKRHEAVLRMQQVQTRAIIDSASDPFIALDSRGIITDWNAAAESTFGWSREAAVGQVLADTIVPPRYRAAHVAGLERVRAGGEAHVLNQRVEIEAQHRDGSPLQVELAIWRAGEDAAQGYNAFLRDITDRKRHEQELSGARDQALEGSRAKSEFLATMSHEIRTPMNGVIGLCGLLLDTDLDDVQRRYAGGVRGAGESLLAIIDDILDFSKLEAGKVELEQVTFDPRQVVEEIGVLLGSAAADKSLEMVAYCDPDVPAALIGDPGRLRQVLINLASNAVKFTAAGEVVLSASLLPGTSAADDADGAAVRFAITDTGIGIEPEVQSRLFQPFTQADASTTRRFGGTGLGLVICERLVGAMGGHIDLDSAPGAGSTFSFTVSLPRSVDAAALDVPQPDLLHGTRVLVVDDNETNRMVLSAQLRAWGMRPDVAVDAREALELQRSAARNGSPYGIAILDLCMPHMNGLALATQINVDPLLTGTQTMILTSAGAPDPELAREAGVQHWASKPVRSSELYAALMTMAAPRLGAATGRAADTQALALPLPRSARGRVLVVEDNEVNQLVAQGVLRKLGFASDLAADGRQALAALEVSDYDVVLMDCHMPEMDGFQATAELRRREARSPQVPDQYRRRTPVIAMTAGVLAEDKERCRAAGMDDFVPKPVEVDVLESALDRQLRPRSDPAPAAAPAPSAAHPGGGVSGDDSAPAVLDPVRLQVLRRLDPDGAAGLVPAVVRAFLQDAPTRMAAVREATTAGGGAALERSAHQLKGAAANLGATRVAALCDRLEALGRSGDGTGTDLLDELQAELDRAALALADVPSATT